MVCFWARSIFFGRSRFLSHEYQISKRYNKYTRLWTINHWPVFYDFHHQVVQAVLIRNKIYFIIISFSRGLTNQTVNENLEQFIIHFSLNKCVSKLYPCFSVIYDEGYHVQKRDLPYQSLTCRQLTN
jgi:hypothetical protein